MVPSIRFAGFLRTCAVGYQGSGAQNATHHCVQKANSLYQHKSYHDVKLLQEKRTQDLEMRTSSKKDPYLNLNKSGYQLSERKGPMGCDEPKKPKTSVCEEPKKEKIVHCEKPKKENIIHCEKPKKENIIHCEKPKKEVAHCEGNNEIVEFGYSVMDQFPDLIPWEERCKSKTQNLHFGVGIIAMAITTVVTWYTLKP